MKSPVTSITDDQLAIIEALTDAAVDNPGEFEDSDEEFELMSQIRPTNIAGLIARLRAAEADAKRWRHARRILTVEAIETAQSDFINFGLPPAESESIRADQAIDAAMERKQ